MRLTIVRSAAGEYGRRWYHRFTHLDRAFDRAPKARRKLAWQSELLAGKE